MKEPEPVPKVPELAAESKAATAKELADALLEAEEHLNAARDLHETQRSDSSRLAVHEAKVELGKAEKAAQEASQQRTPESEVNPIPMEPLASLSTRTMTVELDQTLNEIIAEGVRQRRIAGRERMTSEDAMRLIPAVEAARDARDEALIKKLEQDPEIREEANRQAARHNEEIDQAREDLERMEPDINEAKAILAKEREENSKDRGRERD